jgi:hypothetical protein
MGGEGDNGQEIAGDSQYVPLNDRMIFTDESSMNAFIGQSTTGFVSLLLLEIVLHSKDAVLLRTVTATNLIGVVRTEQLLQDSHARLKTESYNMASAAESFAGTWAAERNSAP